jgi:hypothetical protein|nr:MAG TPA: copper transport outer membrane protein [Caudoviricetes sp.]
MKYLIRTVIAASVCLTIGIQLGCAAKRDDLAAWEEMQAVSRVDNYEQLPDVEKVRGDAEAWK